MALVFTVELQRLDVDLAVYATMVMMGWAGVGGGSAVNDGSAAGAAGGQTVCG